MIHFGASNQANKAKHNRFQYKQLLFKLVKCGLKSKKNKNKLKDE